MKLSIHVIFETLFSDTGKLVSSEEVNHNLSGVRLLSENTPKLNDLSSENVYIVNSSRLTELNLKPEFSIICLDSVADEMIDKFKSAIILTDMPDQFITLTRIQDLFDSYQTWENSINEAILSEKPLQTVLDLCGAYIKNPIALFDNHHALLMKTGIIPENSEGSIWEYVLKKGYSPKEAESDYLNSKLLNTTGPFFYRSRDKYSHINRLLASIRYRQSLFGCLAISDISAPITKTEYANMSHIQRFINTALAHSNEFLSFSAEAPAYILQLLQGYPVERSILSYNLANKSKKVDQSYYIWAFSPLDSMMKEDYLVDSYLPDFNRHFKTDFCFSFRNQIIVIEYDLEKHGRKSHLNTTREFLEICGFKGAFSMVFHDISEIRFAYRQCQIVLVNNTLNNSSVEDFRNHYMSYILRAIQRATELDDLLYPGIKKMLTKEKNYGLELLFCLQEYIIHGRNLSATAEALDIHRHTVMYRLNNINQLMMIDINSLDEDSLLHLYMSCRTLIMCTNQ